MKITNEEHKANMKDIHWAHVQTVLFLLYPGVSKVVLQAFHCRLINGEWYLVADLNEVCYTSDWTANAALALVGVALYPIGIVVYTAVILFRNEHKLWKIAIGGDRNKMKVRYGLLYGRYEERFFFWVRTVPLA